MFDFLKRKSGEGMYPDEPASPFPDSESSMPQLDQGGMPSFPSNPSPPSGGLPPLEPSRSSFDSSSRMQEPRPSFQEPPRESIREIGNRDEVILAKLDSIRTMLDMLNHRVANLEGKLDNQKKW